MIDEKKIEEAAIDASIDDTNKDTNKDIVRDCHVISALTAYELGFQDGFKAGISWFLDNLWHDASEEPKENRDILIESLNGTYTEYAAYRHNSAQLWSDFVDRSHTIHWLYIDDLLKGGK